MNYLSKLLKNEDGNFAIIAATSLGVIMFGVAAAVDINTIVSTKAKLANAVDSSVLAAASSGEDRKKDLTEVARATFDQNVAYIDGQSLKSFKLKKLPDDVIRAEAVVIHQPAFGKLLGIKKMRIEAISESMLPSVNGLDVAFVLDRTGSMAGSNISNLKTATRSFLDELSRDGSDVRVSIVPFADYVNIGLDNANESWLDLPVTNTFGGDDAQCVMEPQSASTCSNPFTNPPPACVTDTNTNTSTSGTETTTVTTTTTNNGDGTCTIRIETNVTDGASSSSSVSTTTRSDNPSGNTSAWNDISLASNGNFCTFGSDPADNSGNRVEECSINQVIGDWYGCVGSRAGALNIKAGYSGDKIPPALGRTCGQPLLSLSNDFNAAKDSIESLTASGSTYIPAGLMWGWRSLDPQEPLNVTSSEDRTKLIVLMTDGQNTISQSGLFHTGRDGSAANTLTSSLCEEIKKDDLQIATISYSTGSRDSATTQMLKSCASNSSLYFEPSSADGLKEAFANAVNSTQGVRLVN